MSNDGSGKSAAFRIRNGGKLDISGAQLHGHDQVLDADNIGNVTSRGLIAHTRAPARPWGMKILIGVIIAVLGLVLGTVALRALHLT